MVDAPPKNILIGDNVFKEYKGAFTEQYVAQQIVACNVTQNTIIMKIQQMKLTL